MKFKILFFIFFIPFSLFSQVNLTQGEEAKILTRHNFYRDIVSSQKMRWSDSLAFEAKIQADKIAENPYSAKVADFYGVNIFRSPNRPAPYDVVDFWAKEQRYYYGQELNKNNILRFGHYTQIVWNQTVSIGCALAKTQGGTFILVCLYSPKGNIIGQKPY